MDCDSAREAISARIDGEDDAADAALETHLAGCAGCRAWMQRAHAVTRRARLGGAFLDHDLVPGLLAAMPAREARWRRRSTQRAALLALALAQLAIAFPMLVLGHDQGAGVHAAHELGSFNFALAAAFAVGAVRPKLSAGLAWPCALASAGLVVTALADLFSGQAIGTDEALHLVAVAGAALLAWQAHTLRDTAAAQATATSAASDVTARPAAAGVPAAAAEHPQPPGGSAARLSAPDTAAHAPGRAAESASPVRGDGGRGESVA